jgi:molecular chaperone GrpE
MMIKTKKTDKEPKVELKQQIEELTAKWQRAVADYRNLEMRMAKEKEDWMKFGNRVLLLEVLEILDDLERAKQHVKESGLALIIDKFRRLLGEQGVAELAVGKEFDPNLMECVEQVAGEKNEVVSIEQKGYLYHDRLLRPAKVKVGKGK